MTKDEARARAALKQLARDARRRAGAAGLRPGAVRPRLNRRCSSAENLALDEGRRAIALTPLQKDFNNGSFVLEYFAITVAWAGEKELALQQLETGLRAPDASLMLSYGALKLHPFWDPLRAAIRASKKLSPPSHRKGINHN